MKRDPLRCVALFALLLPVLHAQTPKRLIYGGDAHFPPYEYLDADKHPQGFNVQLVEAVAKESGIPIEIRLADWHQTVDALNSGAVDFINLGYSDARAQKYDLLPPAWILHQDLVFLNNRSSYPQSLEQLGAEQVCVEEGSLMQEMLREMPQFRRPALRVTTSQLSCLPLLSKLEVTAVAGNGLALLHAARQNGLEDLHTITVKTITYHYATQKGRGAQLAPLSQALDRIRQSGKLARLVEEYLTLPPARRPWRDYAGYIVAMAAMLLIVVGLVVAWNRSLHWQVRTSTAELLKSQKAYEALLNSIDGIVWEADCNMQFAFVSAQAEKILGYPIQEWLQPGFARRLVAPDDRDRVFEDCARETALCRDHQSEFRACTADGQLLWMRNLTSVIVENGQPSRLRGIMVDITASKNLEDQLLQAQKMEAVGQLAGGIAHDFNNLLTVIKGYSALLSQKLGVKHSGEVDEIQRAADKAAALTRQLLAFSRRQVLQPTVLDLNGVIHGLQSFVTRLIGEDIEVLIDTEAKLGRVRADQGQIEQVLMNLLVNARDAMPNGGMLRMSTSNVEVDQTTAAARPPLRPGPYVGMTVSDSGEGMDAATQARVFEPFFTTKGQGKGTGLGLATVYGIVKQSGGYIWVTSALGAGTTFEILLPRIAASDEMESPAPLVGNAAGNSDTATSSGGKETILLVEDEEAVRHIAQAFLQSEGYTVLCAANAEDAIDLSKHYNGGTIDLVVTDVILTGMSGRALAEILETRTPGIAVLYISGYAKDKIGDDSLTESADFLQKPFSRNVLLSKVRALLDRRTLGAKP